MQETVKSGIVNVKDADEVEDAPPTDVQMEKKYWYQRYVLKRGISKMF